ncbi:unnamed protein product [Fusarium graminearum]|nr:unnamed protein product [Fusarium graminearum]CAF3634784.1 unnamed protein product [Fusarium graminearum]CAG1973390.1 unnamed protein product [Fusarium graminearum]CAG1989041.1 unnamed protein product [Fusarium graminearum]
MLIALSQVFHVIITIMAIIWIRYNNGFSGGLFTLDHGEIRPHWMVQDVEARRMLECPWRVLGNLAETYKRGEATNDMGKQTFTSINGPIALFRGHTEQSNTRSQYCINLTVTTVKSITVELIPPQDGRPLGKWSATEMTRPEDGIASHRDVGTAHYIVACDVT